jgi:hypothetical protein
VRARLTAVDDIDCVPAEVVAGSKRKRSAIDRSDDIATLSAEEELALLSAYERRILLLCDELGLHLGIASTSTIFFKRFFIMHSPRVFPPVEIMHTAIFLGIKTEACPYTEVREMSQKLARARECYALSRSLPPPPSHPISVSICISCTSLNVALYCSLLVRLRACRLRGDVAVRAPIPPCSAPPVQTVEGAAPTMHHSLPCTG